jgi:hypothetical protein
METAADLIGKPAPEIVADEWFNGAAVQLADLRGKVVVLDIGAYLPSAYTQSARELIGLATKHANDDLIVITVHRPVTDRDRNGVGLDEIQAYLDTHQLPLRVAIDRASDSSEFWGGQTKEEYQIRSWNSAMIIIDRKGIIRAAPTRRDLKSWIAKLLAEQGN